MKKLAATLLSLSILSSVALPVSAAGWPSVSSWPSWNQGQITIGSSESTVGIPKITEATYCHKNPAYSGFDNHIQICWDEVENAEKYEMVITKGDGATLSYTLDAPCHYAKTDCPKTYSEKEKKWKSATVKVRAISNGIKGRWSSAKKISCNAIH